MCVSFDLHLFIKIKLVGVVFIFSIERVPVLGDYFLCLENVSCVEIIPCAQCGGFPTSHMQTQTPSFATSLGGFFLRQWEGS